MKNILNQFLDPVLALIAKEELTDEEVLKCQQIIYDLIAYETRHQPLPLPLPVAPQRFAICNKFESKIYHFIISF